MTKEPIWSVCKFYKGEKENPYEHKSLFDKNGNYKNHLDRNRASLWFYESIYIEMLKTKGGVKTLQSNLDEYKAYNGKQIEEIPELLLALLFNRYFHWSFASPSNPDAMNEFYKFIDTFYISQK